MDRKRELLDKYISEGMSAEDLIEMIVSLEKNVEDLEFQLSEIYDSMQE